MSSPGQSDFEPTSQNNSGPAGIPPSMPEDCSSMRVSANALDQKLALHFTALAVDRFIANGRVALDGICRLMIAGVHEPFSLYRKARAEFTPEIKALTVDAGRIANSTDAFFLCVESATGPVTAAVKQGWYTTMVAPLLRAARECFVEGEKIHQAAIQSMRNEDEGRDSGAAGMDLGDDPEAAKPWLQSERTFRFMADRALAALSGCEFAPALSFDPVAAHDLIAQLCACGIVAPTGEFESLTTAIHPSHLYAISAHIAETLSQTLGQVSLQLAADALEKLDAEGPVDGDFSLSRELRLGAQPNRTVYAGINRNGIISFEVFIPSELQHRWTDKQEQVAAAIEPVRRLVESYGGTISTAQDCAGWYAVRIQLSPLPASEGGSNQVLPPVSPNPFFSVGILPFTVMLNRNSGNNIHFEGTGRLLYLPDGFSTFSKLVHGVSTLASILPGTACFMASYVAIDERKPPLTETTLSGYRSLKQAHTVDQPLADSVSSTARFAAAPLKQGAFYDGEGRDVAVISGGAHHLVSPEFLAAIRDLSKAASIKRVHLDGWCGSRHTIERLESQAIAAAIVGLTSAVRTFASAHNLERPVLDIYPYDIADNDSRESPVLWIADIFNQENHRVGQARLHRDDPSWLINAIDPERFSLLKGVLEESINMVSARRLTVERLQQEFESSGVRLPNRFLEQIVVTVRGKSASKLTPTDKLLELFTVHGARTFRRGDGSLRIRYPEPRSPALMSYGTFTPSVSRQPVPVMSFRKAESYCAKTVGGRFTPSDRFMYRVLKSEDGEH